MKLKIKTTYLNYLCTNCLSLKFRHEEWYIVFFPSFLLLSSKFKIFIAQTEAAI